jgi:hypothetical protein
MDSIEPELDLMDWDRVEAVARSAEMMAELREVPKLLPRTTHVIARLAQAIMAHIGLHFTASGFTTRLVDNVQLPNIQAVSLLFIIKFTLIITITIFIHPHLFSIRVGC